MKTFAFIVSVPFVLIFAPVLCVFGADLLTVDNGKSNF